MSPNFPILLIVLHSIFFATPKADRVETFRKPGEVYLYESVMVIRHDEDKTGYNIYYPKSDQPLTAPVVLFVHGYGAINPMIFGAWIDHLVLQGNIVIYPRYQQSLIFPSTEEFTGLVAGATKQAMTEIGELPDISASDKFVVVGHSYGGVIAANLATLHDSLEIPTPDAVFCGEPGHGPLLGGVLDSYSGADPNVPVVIVVGDNDWTVGDDFGKRLFSEMPKGQPRLLIRQKEVKEDSLRLTASHYEPYAVGDFYDNGNHNMTFKRAMKTARTNAIDFEVYWKILDTLLDCSYGDGSCLQSLASPWSLGCWPGTDIPIQALQVEGISGITQ